MRFTEAGTEKIKKEKLVGTVTGTKFTYKIKDGIYQKIYVKALDSNGKELSRARTLHIARPGYGYGDPVGIRLSKKSVTVRVGKKKQVKGWMVKLSRVTVHRGIRYESSNPRIAKVNAKTGVVKGVRKGECLIYVYAQNGLFETVDVRVK